MIWPSMVLERSAGARPTGAPVGMEVTLRASTLEGQIMRVADLIAYVNHDIDDATRAGLLSAETLPAGAVDILGASCLAGSPRW